MPKAAVDEDYGPALR